MRHFYGTLARQANSGGVLYSANRVTRIITMRFLLNCKSIINNLTQLVTQEYKTHLVSLDSQLKTN